MLHHLRAARVVCSDEIDGLELLGEVAEQLK
jgi:hypothetical protein